MKNKKIVLFALLTALFSVSLASCDSLMPQFLPGNSARVARSSVNNEPEPQKESSFNVELSSGREEQSAPISSNAPIESSSSPNSEHVHTFSPAWSRDEERHWKEATCGHDVRGDEGEHQFVEISRNPATYDSFGTVVYKCSICNYRKSEILEMLEHKYTEYYYNENYHWRELLDEGHEGEEVDYGPHVFTLSSNISATFEEPEQYIYKCKYCGYTKIEYGQAALPHNYSTSYEYDNYGHWHKCIDEGYEQLIKGWSIHDFVITESIPATFTTEGKNTYTCTVCGYSYQESTPLAEHQYAREWSSDLRHHWRQCIDEGYEYLYDEYSDHYFNTTDSSNGFSHLYCVFCGINVLRDWDDYYYDTNIQYDDIYMYYLMDNGEYAVGLNRTQEVLDDNSPITVPTSFNGVPVTRIAPFAFADSQTTSITIPDGIVSAGNNAFGWCYNIQSIDFPESFRNIGQNTFFGCANLQTITFAGFVEYIPENNFIACNNLVSINILSEGGNYKTLNGALYDEQVSTLILCPKGYVGEFVIPSSVQNISGEALRDCLYITSYSVESGNLGFTAQDGILYDLQMTNIIAAPKSIEGSITIPNNVTRIGDNAFAGCDKLTAVYIPDGVNYIGQAAFANCYSLSTISIPGSVETIAYSAFENCRTLENIELPTGLKYVYFNAFFSCSNLKTISIPATVELFEPLALQACTALTTITVDENSPYYSSQDGVLYNSDKTIMLVCPGAKTGELVVPEGVVTLNEYSLYSSCYIESIVLPSTFSEVDPWVFINCRNLSSFVVSNDNSSFSSLDGVLFNKDQTVLVAYPRFKNHGGTYTVPNTVTNIYTHAFNSCTLSLLVFPNNVKYFDHESFTSATINDIAILNPEASIPLDILFDYRDLQHIYVTSENVANTLNVNMDFAMNHMVYMYSEYQPAEGGYYWHYVDGVITIW